MKTAKIKIGARGSPLSLAQTLLVAQALQKANPGVETEIITIKTTGDKILDAPLAQIGGKGLFVKEIEEALLNHDIDLAIHSAKDLPANLPEGLILAATPQRADPRDALISRGPLPNGISSLEQGALIGTSGLRRQAQLLWQRPDLNIKPLRGNVGTRLKKLETEFQATLLSAAGLARLGGENPPHMIILDTKTMLPAAGQGTLAIEARESDELTLPLLAPIHHHLTSLCLSAERGFLRRLGSGCQLPVAALAAFNGSTMTLDGLVASLDGHSLIRRRCSAEITMHNQADELGFGLAQHILDNGGREIMESLCIHSQVKDSI